MSGKSGLAGVRDLFRLDCERLQGQASLDSEFTVSGRKLIELVSPFDRRSLDVSLNFMMDRECRGADTDGALELPVKTRLHDTKLDASTAVEEGSSSLVCFPRIVDSVPRSLESVESFATPRTGGD